MMNAEKNRKTFLLGASAGGIIGFGCSFLFLFLGMHAGEKPSMQEVSPYQVEGSPLFIKPAFFPEANPSTPSIPIENMQAVQAKPIAQASASYAAQQIPLPSIPNPSIPSANMQTVQAQRIAPPEPAQKEDQKMEKDESKFENGAISDGRIAFIGGDPLPVTGEQLPIQVVQLK